MEDKLYRARIEKRVYEVLIEEGLVEGLSEKCFSIGDSLDGLKLTTCVGEEFGVEVGGEDLKEMIGGEVVQVSFVVDYLVGRKVSVEQLNL